MTQMELQIRELESDNIYLQQRLDQALQNETKA